MKNFNKISQLWAGAILLVLVSVSCKKYLDQEPLSTISPEKYLQEESQLGAYAITRYTDILPSHTNYSFGTFGIDANTDNMATTSMDNRYAPGLFKVGSSGGDWDFSNIYQLNYFLQDVVPKWKTGKIGGSEDKIKQYIGEVYFLRAYVYFSKLQALGDFPIIKTTLSDDAAKLKEASRRMPRTEVARFILADLDSAAMLMNNPDGSKNRLSKNCALLLKSRVGLYEGTWLKYFKGTAFVPNGPSWPGANKAYNAGYQFKAGSIEAESQFFLSESMSAAKAVADAVQLVTNTGIIESANNENPYFNMFSNVNMAGYSEVLLWRQYSVNITHNVPVYAQLGNNSVGLTRSMVESFLMANGLPIYAPGSGYKGDDYIKDVREGRDGRLNLFLKEPGQKNQLVNIGAGSHGTTIEPIPAIDQSSAEKKYSTGYTIRKGLSYDGAQTNNGGGYTGSVTFRATEAYLNYIEADFERNGVLDAVSVGYWQQIRTRAKVDPDFNKTIAATNMNLEKKDWGAYSNGVLVNPTLYNIRRERRNEFMAEGLRFMDLKRWRAMDQMISTPDHIEGFKLWGPMKDWYKPAQLASGASNPGAIVSDPALSLYLRPYEIYGNNESYKGVRWTMAHYLNPIAAQHFIITAENGDSNSAVIYQNPGWPVNGGAAAIGF